MRALFALLLVACIPVRSDPIVMSARDVRLERAGAAFARYSPDDRRLIRAGRVRKGLDEFAAYLAFGDPTFHFATTLDGRSCHAMLYGLADASRVDSAVYTCDGRIVYLAEVRPKLPCWRVLAAGRRAVERADHFDRAPLGRQWEMLAGVLARGQTSDDVYVAFGRPYNTGSEAREDGTNAAVQVFLDRPGEAYGLYVTIVDGKTVAWRFPPDRTLTPEAQQRRLDAMEHRLVDQLRRMEATSIAQHQEEMALLGEIQEQGEAMRATLAVAAEAAARADRTPAAASGVEPASFSTAPSSGSPALETRPAEPEGPRPALGTESIRMGAACSECDQSAARRHGVTCATSARETCGGAAAMCVARPTDASGLCTFACSDRSPCPAGYSCADAGVGEPVCLPGG